MRRILLSSLPGCSLTSVKINGVLHEFSSIPNVVEDVPEIIVNLKNVRLKFDEEEVSIISEGFDLLREQTYGLAYTMNISKIMTEYRKPSQSGLSPVPDR